MALLTADAKAPGGIEGRSLGRRCSDRRSHGGQQRHRVPVQEQGREDDGGGGRLRRRGPHIPRRRHHRAECGSGEARADVERPRVCQPGRLPRRRPSRRTTSTSHASATCTAGAGRRTKAGCARRSTRSACPTRYFADQKLKDGNLRSKYDVIIFPHVGGSAQSQVNGTAMTGNAPLPYKKTADTPNLGYVDQSDDIRGGMGLQGLLELAKFVQEGGTLITEGSTSTIFPEYAITNGVTVEEPARLFVRGSILRAKIADKKSPLVYGYEQTDLPVYFNQAPVLNVASGLAGLFGRGGGGGRGGAPGRESERRLRPEHHAERGAAADSAVRSRCEPARRQGRSRRTAASRRSRARSGRWRRRPASRSPKAARASSCSSPRTRTTCCCRARWRMAKRLANRAALVDEPLGKGHVVMFAHAAVLAVADAGHLHARVQRDHELERPRRRQAGCRRARHGVAAAISESRKAMNSGEVARSVSPRCRSSRTSRAIGARVAGRSRRRARIRRRHDPAGRRGGDRRDVRRPDRARVSVIMNKGGVVAQGDVSRGLASCTAPSRTLAGGHRSAVLAIEDDATLFVLRRAHFTRH